MPDSVDTVTRVRYVLLSRATGAAPTRWRHGMRDANTERTQVLRAVAMDTLDSWGDGYLGICPLTGRRMFLTERAARVATTADAIKEYAHEHGGYITDAMAFRLAEQSADRVTGRTDGAHAPTARAHGGTRLVLTDADAQQALGDADTLGTEDVPSIDTRTVRGVAEAKRRVAEARRRLR